MSYFKPYIDASGYHYPSYVDIREALKEDCKKIYGDDIYLENDAADYQMICCQATYIFDCYQAMEKVYNSRSPSSAIGTGLDSICKINSIKRIKEEYSECIVECTGNKNVKVYKGVVIDKSNIQWNLDDFEFDSEGKATVKATCSIAGPIVANPGDINKIFNSVYGWNTVSNKEPAKVGRYRENDSELRVRRDNSTMISSKTIVEGIEGDILNIKDVRLAKVYENDTDIVNSLGLPPHSITCVVEGGDDSDIAYCIYNNKTPGCYTNGEVEININTLDGDTDIIRFKRKTSKKIKVQITLKKLNAFTDYDASLIKNNVSNYINCLNINVNVDSSVLWGISMSSLNYSNPNFSIISIKIAEEGSELSAGVIEIPYYCSAASSIDDIEIVEA